jgi:hypothetical protein
MRGDPVPADRISINLGALEDAFMLADLRDQGMDVEVYVHRGTGKIVVRTDDMQSDDFPDNAENSPDYLPVPTKRDLGHDSSLVFLFAKEEMREHRDEIFEIFERRGAYGRFKDLLRRTDKLDAWHAFENQAVIDGLTQWCRKHGFDVTPR